MFRILYVEDDDTYFYLIKSLIQSLSDEIPLVFWIKDKEGFELLNASPPHFDLIVFDGNIKGWPNHINDVQKLYPLLDVIIHTGEPRGSFPEFAHVYEKTPDGLKCLLGAVAEKIYNKKGED